MNREKGVSSLALVLMLLVLGSLLLQGMSQQDRSFASRVSMERDVYKRQMQTSSTPEFDGWRWVSYWYPVRQVVSFKRDVYRRVMKEFASVVMSLQENTPKPQNASAYRRKRG